jgi:hypothetical protein
MRFKRSVVSIKSLLSQIRGGLIDLQPNFQRGEVWSEPRKQSLVDSVLRKWYIPPIHIVQVKEGHRREVLDGKQRLTAIIEFANDEFPVDGGMEPKNKWIESLDGFTYSGLPPKAKANFDNFNITVLTLVDYGPAEPGELFFRLNQPATLTAAEKRNAFYGSARDQVKEWVQLLESNDIDESVLGFSNVRMAYDDTLARVALTVEYKTLAKKVTADDLVEVYRSENGFSRSTDRTLQSTIRTFSAGARAVQGDVRYNKATLYSWLVFLVRGLPKLDRQAQAAFPDLLSKYLVAFSRQVESVFHRTSRQQGLWDDDIDPRLLLFYQSRATSRVADVSSVVIRDLITWIYFHRFLQESKAPDIERVRNCLTTELTRARKIYDAALGSPFSDEDLERASRKLEWELVR